jgi:hypothetical protein
MSYGFIIRDVNNNITLDSSNYGFTLLDLIVVDPSTSGSRTYPELAEINVFAAQSQVEPSVTTVDNLLNLSSVNISITNSGTSKVVSWFPRFIKGTKQNVNIYVMGM